jgi:hypothetical protein
VKVSEAQKALLYTDMEKGSRTSSEEHYAKCRIQLTMMSSKNTRECLDDADAWERTTEWTLSGH